VKSNQAETSVELDGVGAEEPPEPLAGARVVPNGWTNWDYCSLWPSPPSPALPPELRSLHADPTYLAYNYLDGTNYRSPDSVDVLIVQAASIESNYFLNNYPSNRVMEADAVREWTQRYARVHTNRTSRRGAP